MTFDPDMVRVTAVSGTDEFDAPVANVDNENGSVTFNQVRSGEATDPRLVQITVETVGTDGQQSELSFDASETKFSNETGGTFAPDELRSLTLSVESTTPTPMETTTATETATATPTETPTSPVQMTDTETPTATGLSTSAGTAADPASATTEPRAESPGTTTESREAVSQSVPGFGVTVAFTAFVLLGGGLLIRRRRT